MDGGGEEGAVDVLEGVVEVAAGAVCPGGVDILEGGTGRFKSGEEATRYGVRGGGVGVVEEVFEGAGAKKV